MNSRRARIWLGFAALALLVSGPARAQSSVPTASSINLVQCSAVTVLSPDPAKVAQDMAVAAAAAAVKVATAASAASAAIEAAARGAAKAVTAEVQAAAFKVPQPKLKKTEAEWGSDIELTFAPVEGLVAKCLEADLHLFLDHHPTGLTPVGRSRDGNGNVTLAYRLNRPATSTPGWTELLAKGWTEKAPRPITVGVGLANTEISIAQGQLNLTLGSGSPSWAFAALLVSIAVLVIVMWNSNAVMDRREGASSYSVSRLLLSFWVLTTISAVMLMLLRFGLMPSATESGFAFMLAISGGATGLSAVIDLIRKPVNTVKTDPMTDLFSDADGLALHRVQVVFFNLLVLGIVWRDLIWYGTVARIDTGWAVLMGASAMTFVFGKSGESIRPSLPPVVRRAA